MSIGAATHKGRPCVAARVSNGFAATTAAEEGGAGGAKVEDGRSPKIHLLSSIIHLRPVLGHGATTANGRVCL